jgi:hypothetical protein
LLVVVVVVVVVSESPVAVLPNCCSWLDDDGIILVGWMVVRPFILLLGTT